MSKKNLDVNGGITRRTFVKGAGATAGVAAVGMGSSRLEAGPVQEAEAIAPLVIYGAAIGSSVAVGWALREFEVVGADAPPEGLTADALEDRLYQTVVTRKSTNASTFIDNQNILTGIEHVAYADGKVAAIDSLNEQNTQQTVQDAGLAAVDAYETTIKSNFLKSWNESVSELFALKGAVDSHPDMTFGSLMTSPYWGAGGYTNDYEFESLTQGTRAHTLPDGSEMDLLTVQSADTGDFDYSYDPVEVVEPGGGFDPFYFPAPAVPFRTAYGNIDHLLYDEWSSVWTNINNTFEGVRNGLITWVEGVYSSVQSGELDTAELLTPRELAEMTTDDETFNQAVADLMALNVSVNLEREAEIRLPNIGATLYGSIAVSGDTTLSPGTIDPSADSLSYYFTYNVAEGEGTWDAYQAGVDGGNVTFTSEPFPSSSFIIETAAGESAEVTTSDFTDNGDGTWTASLSAQLETAITEVSAVTYYAESTETDYQTVQLTSPFEIVIFRDSEGTEVASADYTSSAPQDDTNYITEEEWKAQEERYQELIDEYEESAGGGAGFASLLEGDGGLAVLALVGAAAFGLLRK